MPDNQDEDVLVRLEQVRKSKQTHANQPQGDPAAPLSGTEDEVAVEFSNRHAAELRYVNLWHHWLRWEDAMWRRVTDLSVFHAVRKIAREYANIHNDKKLGKDAATAAIERVARNDPRHDTPADTWDVDDDLFNNPNRKPSR
jgi:putative DNA primase/helicase